MCTKHDMPEGWKVMTSEGGADVVYYDKETDTFQKC